MPKLEAFETGLIIIFDKTWNDEKTEGKIGLERIYNTWYGASIRMKKKRASQILELWSMRNFVVKFTFLYPAIYYFIHLNSVESWSIILF